MNQICSAEEAILKKPVIFSVVIPVYGSACILPELHNRLTVAMHGLGKTYEIIFVDDCGLDDSWRVLQDLAKKDTTMIAIQLMRNSGQSNATLCGLAHASGELIFTMDDDLQHPPEEISRLLEAMNEDVDVVMGVPIEKKHHWFRRLGSRLAHNLNCYLLGKDRHLRFSSFRLMRRQVVYALLELRTLSPALGPLINSVTHRIINTKVLHAPREKGRSNYTLGRLLSVLKSNLIGFSMLPLRLLAVLGLIGAVLSLIISLVLIFSYLIRDKSVPGWTSLALSFSIISGFNFLAFSILGEYVLQILKRVNRVPRFNVRAHINLNRK